MASGYSCYERGDIYVKGKGIITTYFVKTPFDSGNHPQMEPDKVKPTQPEEKKTV